MNDAVTWTQAPVALVGKAARAAGVIRFAQQTPCVVEVWVDSDRVAIGEGLDLFDALIETRRSLEQKGWLLACEGSRRDVYPSPMLRQATCGRRAYVLTKPRSTKRPPTVDIFDAAPDDADIVTVSEQRAAFDEWLPPRFGRGRT